MTDDARAIAASDCEAERQDKALNDAWVETAITYKVEWEQELAHLEAETNPDIRHVLEEEIERTRRTLAIIQQCLPG